MPLSKLICPHCKATLKPARPVPEGKKVTCPKCGDSFQAGAAGAARPGKAARPGPEAVPAATAAEEDDDVGTYGVLHDPEEEARRAAEERKKQKKKRRLDEDEDYDEDEDEEDEEEDVAQQYLKTVQSKDPRGPAQMAVIGPSNWLLRTGIIGFLAWLIALVVFIIPIVFSLDEKGDTAKEAFPSGRVDKDKEKKAAAKKEEDVISFASIREEPWQVGVAAGLLVLALAQAALIANGAVKMLHLESVGWARAAAILAIFPLYALPVFWILWWFTVLIFDEMGVVVAAAVFLWGPIVGLVNLKTLARQKVKAGFEYVAD
jgi:hypothetical protein